MVSKWLGLTIVGTSLVLGGACARSKPDSRHIVTFWQPFDFQSQPALEKMVAAFEKTHPGTLIRMSYAANDLTSSQKLFLAIAGGVGPDVTFVDGQQLSEWAARGALADLTPFVQKAGITGDDFWRPRWDESTYRGKVFALPWGADPNFALAWNKDLFRRAGLNPDRAPRTIKELDDDNGKLTSTGANGAINTVGLVPWAWGGANSLFTWGYAFGGNFYEEPNPGKPFGVVTADNPRNVAALTWMAQFAKRYDVRKVASYNSQFVGAANNPFFTGKTAMTVLHISQVRQLKQYAPTVDYGIGLLPAPPDGEYPTGWIGGWSLAVPRSRKVSPEAFEFVRWMCMSRVATQIGLTDMDNFPGYRKSDVFKRVESDPQRRIFLEILRHSKHVRTLMPVQGYYMELLDRAVDQVLYGDRSPQEALAEASAKAQSRLESVVTAVDERASEKQ